MGLTSKISFKSKKSTTVLSANANTPGSKVPVNESGFFAAPVAPGAAQDDDDEATIFTTMMILYYGFFGLTMVVYPWVHAADVCPWNPLAYWTTISDETGMVFRLAGAAILALVLGPFFDEIFGGVGVQMKAFTRQCTVINFILFFAFLYYSFYSPLPTAVPLMWKAQAIVGGLILGWNLVEAVPVLNLAGGYALVNTLMYGFFGLTLVSVPSILYGPPSPVAYWSEWNDVDLLAGRGLGFAMIALAIVGYYYYRTSGGSYCKQLTVYNFVMLGLFILPAFYGGSSAIARMWEIQLAIGVPILFVGIFLEINGATGSWVVDFACSKCGLNAPSLNYFFLFFYIPFFAAFAYDPDFALGVNSPMPISMFIVPFGETSLFFTKAWCLAMLMILLGPFVFGLSHVSVAKQIMFAHVAYFGLFTYYLLETEVLEFMVMAPLTGLNLIFAILALIAVLPSNSGEAML